MIRNHLYWLAAACLVLLLWGISGFLLPFWFPEWPNTSASFGDGFGSANALFSGLSVIALTYTILLQLESSKSAKQHERLTLLLRLIDEAKNDLVTFTFDRKTGQDAIDTLLVKYQGHGVTIVDQQAVNYLTTVANNLYSILNMIKKENLESSDQELLKEKVSVVYLRHLANLRGTVDRLYFHGELKDGGDMDNLSELLRESLAQLGEVVFPGIETILSSND